ncbi:MAG: hypothetical protein JNL96_18715 [Planctomycetaceae bacterium]|nr:hypothetical protein [Planctomycetaceae bacterium]
MLARFSRSAVWFAAALLCFAAAALPDGFQRTVIEQLQPAKLAQPMDVGADGIVAATIAQREPIGGAMGYAPLTVDRLRRLMLVLGGVFLVVSAAVALWRAGLFRGGPCDFFPVALVVAWATHIVGYRWAVGAGFGFDDDPANAQISTGFLLNDVDNLNYLSWAVQSQYGRNLFSVLFTTEPSAEVFFNPYFWLLGKAARWTGTALPGVLNLAGFLGAIGTIFCVYAIAKTVGLGAVAARWAAVFAAYSSGLTGLTTFLHLQFGLPLLMGCDALFIDATTFSPFLCFPYQAFCFLLTSVIVLLLLQAERAQLEGRPIPWGKLLAAFCLEVFLVASHPYEGMMILGSFGSSFLLSLARRDERSRLALRFGICVLLLVASVPPALYYAWVMRHPVYEEFAVATLSDWRPWWSWLIGYACILPTALYGCVDVYRSRRLRGALWLADWTTVVGFLLIVVNVAATTRFCAGLYIPFCVMAGHGWSLLLERIAAAASPLRRTAGRAAACVVGVLFFFTSFGLLVYGYQPYYYDGQLQNVASALRERSPERFPSLLCDVRSARTLAAIGPVRAFAGHWSQTPGYLAKRDAMTRAGVNPPDYPGAPTERPTRAAFDELTAESRSEYLLVSDDLAGAEFAANSSKFADVGTFGRWRLFVRRP